MAQRTFAQIVFSEIQFMEQAGNFNALILKTLKHYAELGFVRPELLKTIAAYFTNPDIFVPPDTVEMLNKLPFNPKKHSGLLSLLKSYQPKLPKPRIGCVHFPVVFPVITPVGIVRKIRVSDNKGSFLLPWKLRLLEQVGSPVFSVLRQKTGLDFLWEPEQYLFNILDHFENEDNDVKGYSMGLPLALALYSHVTQIPVPTDLSATGDVKSNGAIKPVESIDEKIEALGRERYFIERIFVSHDQQFKKKISSLRLVRFETVKDALYEVFPDKIKRLSFPARIDIQKEKDLIADQYRKSLYTACIDNTEALIRYIESKKDPLRDKEISALFTCFWRKGCSHCHKGEVSSTINYLKKSEKLYQKHPGKIDEKDYFNSQINYAVALKDIFRYPEAEKIHLKIQDEMQRRNIVDRIKGKNFSSLSQLYLAQQRFSEAEKFQNKAIRLIRDDDKYRNVSYLAQVYVRKGDLKKADKKLNQAKQLYNEAGERNLTYLHWFEAEFLYRQGLVMKKRPKSFSGDLHHLASHQYPKIEHYTMALIHKFSGLSLLEEGYEKEGVERLDESISYLENHYNPMFLLLSATIRIERALHFLKTDAPEKAKADIKGIKNNLGGYKDIKKYFQKELKALSRYLRFKQPKEHEANNVIQALESLKKKIPY
jgi:hypothetical protein